MSIRDIRALPKVYEIINKARKCKKYSKIYTQSIFESFAPFYAQRIKERLDIDTYKMFFGRKGSRGDQFSIEILDKNDNILHQRFFDKQAELICFVQGFLTAQEGKWF